MHLARIESLPEEGSTIYKVRTLAGGYLFKITKERILGEGKPSPNYVGVTPFEEEIPATSHHSNLESLMREFFNFNIKTQSLYEDSMIREGGIINTDPYVELPDGTPFFYQRGKVWGLEEKQNLVDSIYNRIETGRVVVRKRDFKHLEKIKNSGDERKKLNVSYLDLVDGKQRLLTLKEFFEGEFPDKNGNYFEDLSFDSQMDFRKTYINVTTLDQKCTDVAVLKTFLRNSTGGVAQEREHLKEIEKALKIIQK
jgi:hypothetical protein